MLENQRREESAVLLSRPRHPCGGRSVLQMYGRSSNDAGVTLRQCSVSFMLPSAARECDPEFLWLYALQLLNAREQAEKVVIDQDRGHLLHGTRHG